MPAESELLSVKAEFSQNYIFTNILCSIESLHKIWRQHRAWTEVWTKCDRFNPGSGDLKTPHIQGVSQDKHISDLELSINELISYQSVMLD